MQDDNLIEKPSCEHEGNTYWIGENAKLSKRTAFGKWTECPFCKKDSPYSIQFVPFGDEWKAMMMRWTKKNLVNLLSSRLKELRLAREVVEEARKVTPGKQILDGLYNALREFDKYDEKGKVNL